MGEKVSVDEALWSLSSPRGRRRLLIQLAGIVGQTAWLDDMTIGVLVLTEDIYSLPTDLQALLFMAATPDGWSLSEVRCYLAILNYCLADIQQDDSCLAA